MEQIISRIEAFCPLCEQERKDKELMLETVKRQGLSVLSRKSELFHITASSFIVNEERTKVLMVFHNIYKSWSLSGGHADGEKNFLAVALKEAKEETGIEHIYPAKEDIFSLDILTTKGHWKNGEYIAPHLHFNFTYLLIGKEEDKIRPKLDENKAVAWILKEEIEKKVTEPEMNLVYKKLLGRID